MKTILSVALGLVLLPGVRAAVYLEEAFNYSTGNLSTPWTGGGSQVSVQTGSLTPPSGLASPATPANKAQLATSSNQTATRPIPVSAIVSGSAYISFLLRQNSIPTTTGGAIVGLDDDGTTSFSAPNGNLALAVHVKQSDATHYQIGIRKGQGSTSAGTGASFAAATFTTSDTVFVVAKYDFSTSPGQVTLWVNPSSSSYGATEASPPSVAATTTGVTADPAGLSNVVLRAWSGSANGTAQIDDLRVGTNWADVTPSSSLALPPSQPVITQTLLSAGGLVLRGTNGTSNGVYQVLMSTNVALPLIQWSAIATNIFATNGNFDCTNPISPVAGQQFYRLLVGGQIIPLPVGPTIATQPTNQTVAVGRNAAFNVLAAGTAPFSYQWYFNTNTPLADATNALLTLANVGTNDAGYYSVIVTNGDGSVTSTQATLTVLVPPAIAAPPTNQTEAAGQNVTFAVSATGSAPLMYQWFFNTNTPLASATNTTLTLTNAQFTNGGGYSVRVTNAVGAVTSSVVTLTVLSPPGITTPPQNQTVTVSNAATFNVVATGTAPLAYQWYFNTNTLLPSATNVSFTIPSAQTNDAGSYGVVITNNYGAVTSTFALLTVNPPSGQPNFSLVGFASLNGFASNNTLQVGGTTGGGAGPLVLATNVTWLVNYAQRSNQPLRILITTNLDLSSLNNNDNTLAGFPTGKILVNNDKTIYSTNGVTLRLGSFHVKDKHNVIIQNLKFRDMWFDNDAADPGYDDHDWDYIRVDGGHHVWVDHCDFNQVYDGMIDMKNGADYTTISWCVFSNQKKCSLLGSSDGETESIGHLNVTFHHNWYTNITDRTPRLRFGNVHIFNMFSQDLHGKAIQSCADGATFIDNVVFAGGTGTPLVLSNSSSFAGTAFVTNSTGITTSLNDAAFIFNYPFPTNRPPYTYTNVLDTTPSVPGVVTNWAGAGKIIF